MRVPDHSEPEATQPLFGDTARPLFGEPAPDDHGRPEGPEQLLWRPRSLPASALGAAEGPWSRPRPGRGLLLVLGVLLLAGVGTALTALAVGGTRAAASFQHAGLTRVRQPIHLSTAQVAERVDPAVVDVNTTVEMSQGIAEAAGTGMFVASDGYIVTNNHVVLGATTIKVTIAGRPGRYAARFVGADPQADVAVIKVDGLRPVPTVQLGTGSSLSVGEAVVAIGNALGLGGTPTVTTGTISTLGRSINASADTGTTEHLVGMIETDAPIEPGNSGGPLVNSSGQVIGMNTAAASASGSKGPTLGFAIPISRVAAIAARIEAGRAGGGVEIGLPAFLGVDGQNVDLVQNLPPRRGVDVVSVVPGAPAEVAGIKQGDVIVGFDGQATPTISALSSLIHGRRPGDLIQVIFESGTGTHIANVRLGDGPAL